MRDVERKKTYRTPADPKDQFRYSTPRSEVTARPVDAMVNHAPDNSLAQAVDLVNNTVSTFTDIAEARNKKERQKGMDAGRLGDVNYGGKSRAFWEGAELTRGEREAKINLRQELSEYFESNKEKDPAEFLEGYKLIAQDKLNGRSEFFLRGFAPVASEMEGQFMVKYQEYQKEKAIAEVEGDANQIMYSDLEVRLGEISKHNDPKTFSAVMAKDLEAYMKRFPGISPMRVATLFTNNVINYAVRYGVPELLDYANQEIGGIHLASDPITMDAVQKARKSAEDYRRIQKEKAEVEYRRRLQESREENTKQELIRAFSLDPRDIGGAQEGMHRIKSNPERFTLSEMNMLMNYYQGVIEGGGFRKFDNYEKTIPFLAEISTGKIPADQAWERFSELYNNGEFSPGGAKEAMNEIQGIKDFAESPEGAATLKTLNRVANDIGGVIGVSHQYNDAITKLNKARAYEADTLLRQWFRITMRQEGRPPTDDEIEAKGSQIIKYYRTLTNDAQTFGDTAEGRAAMGIPQKGMPTPQPKPQEAPKAKPSGQTQVEYVRDPVTGKLVPKQ